MTFLRVNILLIDTAVALTNGMSCTRIFNMVGEYVS